MTDNTTSEENKTTVRRMWEKFFSQGNLDKANKSFAPNHVNPNSVRR